MSGNIFPLVIYLGLPNALVTKCFKFLSVPSENPLEITLYTLTLFLRQSTVLLELMLQPGHVIYALIYHPHWSDIFRSS